MSTDDEPGPLGIDLVQHSVTVLLVDDQRMIGEHVRRMLAPEHDIAFHYCSDPTAAVALATEIRPTVILQDLVMPEIDGLTLVQEFRALAATREIPLIVLSTKEDPAVKADAFARGANDYMVKFPDRLELVARIRYHSRGYISLLERNEAYAALVESQKQLEVRNRFIQEMFGRYLSDEVVASLLESTEAAKLGGDKRAVTILMSDLRGFTSVAENLPAEHVVSMINHYLEAMTDVILAYNGTILEFIGDAILVVFGAPVTRADDADRAMACAVAMQQAIVGVNAWNAEHDLPAVEMGIGVNTGEVVVGNVGSKKRTKYGIVGSQVNLTGRIESYSVGGQILVSESTRHAVEAELRIDGQLTVEPKGVREPITIYEVGGIGVPFDLAVPEQAEHWVELADGIEVEYTILEGKHALYEHASGTIVRVSLQKAELRGTEPIEQMNNIRLRFADPAAQDDPDFYAKCLAAPARSEDCHLLRFTSMPAAVRRRLTAAMAMATRA